MGCAGGSDYNSVSFQEYRFRVLPLFRNSSGNYVAIAEKLSHNRKCWLILDWLSISGIYM